MSEPTSEPTVLHQTIVVRHAYDAAPQRVFRAWADPADLERWYLPGDERWTATISNFDFRVGGGKKVRFGPPEETYTEDCRYVDIVPDRRICYSMSIARGTTPITVSMVTVELLPRGRGCEVRVTDQMAILEAGDDAGARERGWGETLEKLAALLAR